METFMRILNFNPEMKTYVEVVNLFIGTSRAHHVLIN